VSFVAPGDQYMVGRAVAYQIRTSARPITPGNFGSVPAVKGAPKPAPAGRTQKFTVSVPKRARFLAVRAYDRAGNLGDEVMVRIR
jgi:hypothetical protein